MNILSHAAAAGCPADSSQQEGGTLGNEWSLYTQAFVQHARSGCEVGQEAGSGGQTLLHPTCIAASILPPSCEQTKQHYTTNSQGGAVTPRLLNDM